MSAWSVFRAVLGVVWSAHYVLHLLALEEEEGWSGEAGGNTSLSTPNNTRNNTRNNTHDWQWDDKERDDAGGMSGNTIRNIGVGVVSLVIGCAVCAWKHHQRRVRARQNGPAAPAPGTTLASNGGSSAGVSAPSAGSWDLTSASSQGHLAGTTPQPLSTVSSGNSQFYSNNNFLSNYSNVSTYSDYSTYGRI